MFLLPTVSYNSLKRFCFHVSVLESQEKHTTLQPNSLDAQYHLFVLATFLSSHIPYLY